MRGSSPPPPQNRPTIGGKNKRPPPKGCLGLVSTTGCYGKPSAPKLWGMASDVFGLPRHRTAPLWERAGVFGSGPCGPYCLSVDGQSGVGPVYEFGVNLDKYENINIAYLLASMQRVRHRAISKINDQAERHSRTGRGAGGFVNNMRYVQIGPFSFGERRLVESRVDLGGDEFQIREQGWTLADPDYTVVGVGVTISDTISIEQINKLAAHSAFLQAPLYMSTTTRKFIPGTGYTYSIKSTYRISGDGEGRVSCIDVETGGNCQ